MEPDDLQAFLANPGASYNFVTWLRRFLDDPNPVHSTLLITLDGGGSALTAGTQRAVAIKYPCTIVGWTLLADQSGSLVLDLWASDYASYPPTVGNTITASSKPTLSSATHNADIQLVGWKRGVKPGDTLMCHIDSASTVTWATLALQLWKPASHP